MVTVSGYWHRVVCVVLLFFQFQSLFARPSQPWSDGLFAASCSMAVKVWVYQIWSSPTMVRLFYSVCFTRSTSNFFCLLLLLCGDIQANPGPVRYPCSVCKKSVKCNQKALLCDGCA